MKPLLLLFLIVYVVNAGLNDEFDDLTDFLRDISFDDVDSDKSQVSHTATGENINDDELQLRSPTTDAQELIQAAGYPLENYYVTTSDGYILNVLRIPNGKDKPSNGKVVFLQHGLIMACSDWILFGPERGLAYILADAGFDVWLGNNRGNSYSRNHTHLNPNRNADFWNFSWHEIGTIDIPTMIDFVLEKTGKEKLYHVGHSQGTTSFYVMTSMRPEYNSKIAHHVSLAPIAYMKNLRSPLIRMVAYGTYPIGFSLKSLGVNEFLPSKGLLSYLTSSICSLRFGAEVCRNGLFVLCGFNPQQLDAASIPLITSHYPAGSATKQVVHYGQEILSGKFSQYNYGTLVNLIRYKQLRPPSYNLSAITAPITLIYSDNDLLSAPVDVEKLAEQLPNLKEKYLVPDPQWNHIDYLFGIDAPTLVYSKVLDTLLNA